MSNFYKNVLLGLVTKTEYNSTSKEIILYFFFIPIKKFKSYDELDKWLPNDTVKWVKEN